MTDRKQVLWGVNSDSDRLFLSRMCDINDKSDLTGRIMHTRFLTPKEQMLISQRQSHFGSVEFFGGYDDAERKIAFFVPNDWEEKPSSITAVRIRPTNKRTYSHRDYLGSLLALGITRELTGDIVTDSDGAVVFVMQEIADFILMNLSRVASASVKTELTDISSDMANTKSFKDISCTVSSMRLDCVLSAVMGKSRAYSSGVIEEGLASVNYEVTKNTTCKIKSGDIISVKGFGKAVISTDEHLTKKGRIHIEVKKYV